MTFLVLALVNKGPAKIEFTVITAIIPFPVIIGIIDMFT
jgi:hypothetical protein